MRRFSFSKIIVILASVFAIISLISFVVMSIWNSVLVAVLHVAVITFWQAFGIFTLSKILFGGFPGKRGWGPGRGRMHAMRDKWMNMSPEERANFRKEWRGGCGQRPKDSTSEPETVAQ
jgi:Ca2+/H+ antiporter, TMEM165/GDT1 family